MSAHPLSNETILETLEAVRMCGSNTAAANMLGVDEATVRRRLKKAEEMEPANSPEPDFMFPNFPPDDVPIERLIDLQVDRFKARQASYDAHTWFPIDFKTDDPIGILWVGDPHLDDNGCNWPVLKEHIDIANSHPRIYAVNIGDTTNNWAGRLAQLYAKQDTSVKTARRFAEWFMIDSGLRWLVWLIGNHDAWGDGADILARMGQKYSTHKLVCHDWEARFVLRFPGGTEKRVDARHNFKGSSIWNPMHGPMRQGQIGEDCDFLVCGHLHNWGLFHWENPNRGITQDYILDEYARRGGFPEQKRGCSLLSVIDPRSGRHTTFEDVAWGAKFLESIS